MWHIQEFFRDVVLNVSGDSYKYKCLTPIPHIWCVQSAVLHTSIQNKVRSNEKMCFLYAYKHLRFEELKKEAYVGWLINIYCKCIWSLITVYNHALRISMLILQYFLLMTCCTENRGPESRVGSSCGCEALWSARWSSSCVSTTPLSSAYEYI